MCASSVCIVHIWKVVFKAQKKNLIEREVPTLQAREYSGDFAFSNEAKADEYIEALCGIEVDTYGEWFQKTDADGSVWFVYFEEPYELDPANPQLTEV